MSALLLMYPGDGWLILAVNVLVQITAVILMAWLLARVSDRWNAAWRHAIFFVALLCVLASPLLSWVVQANGIALLTLRTPAPAAHVPISAAHTPESRAVAVPTQELRVAPPVEMKAQNLGQVLASESRQTHSLPDILRACGGFVVLIWLIGIAFHLARWCHARYLIAALRREAHPLDCEPLADILRQVRQAVGAARLPSMAISAGLDRPIMVGLIRPLVILPEDALRSLPKPELADILIHECAHAVCLHHLVALLQRVAAMLFWFHPLVHLMNRELARAREEVCDNYVLRRNDAPRYARTLLELSQLLVDTSPQRAALGLFPYRWSLEDRVAGLLDRRRRIMVRANRWAAAALTTIFLFLAILIAGTTVVQADPPVKQESVLRTPSVPALMSTFSAGDQPPRDATNEYAGNIFSVKFSPDGTTLASAWGDGTIKLWNVASHKDIAVLVSPRAHPDETILIKSFAYSPDGKTIASGNVGSTTAGMIRLWNVARGENTATYNGRAEPGRTGIEGIYCVVFSNDGKTLVTGSEDNVIRFWDVASGTVTATLKADPGDMIYTLAISPDEKTLASGSKQGTIKLWDMASGTNTATFKAVGHGNSVFSVAFSPDGKTLGAGGWMEGGGMLWDLASGTCTVKFKPDPADSTATNNPNDMTSSVAFSPDGGVFAQGCDNGIIVLWDVKSRKKIAVLSGHSALVRSLAFSPDGRRLASGSDDSTVKLWSLFAKGGQTTESREGDKNPTAAENAPAAQEENQGEKKAVPDNTQALQGLWEFDLYYSDWWPERISNPPLSRANWRWSVKGDHIRWSGMKVADVNLSFIVDQSKSPWTIDLTFVGGPHKGKSLRGIYKFNTNGVWQICFADADASVERPADVSYDTGAGRTMASLKRIAGSDSAKEDGAGLTREAGQKAAESANATEGKTADVAGQPPVKPTFVVVPVTTELQRRYLGAKESLKAFVLLDGVTLVASDDVAKTIDSPRLARAIAAVKADAPQAEVIFNTLFENTVDKAVVKRLEQVLTSIGREAGYHISGVSFTYAGPYDWDAKNALVNEADDVRESPTESGVGDILVMAYPVRTTATRLILNSDFDCVVFFKKPLNPVDRPLVSLLSQERVKESVSKLDLARKKAILFDVDLASLFDRPYEERNAVQERLYDGNRTGEMEKLADELGFSRASVRFH